MYGFHMGFDLWVFSSQRQNSELDHGNVLRPSTPQGSKNLRRQVRFTWHGSFSEVGWPSPGSGSDSTMKHQNVLGFNGSTSKTGWWFGTWVLFFHILGIIIPTDFHSFQRGWNHQPEKSDLTWLEHEQREVIKMNNGYGTFKHGWKLGTPDAFVIAKGTWW